MCSKGDLLVSRDSAGRDVCMCSECGAVFVVIHSCDIHLVVDYKLSDEQRAEMAAATGEQVDAGDVTVFAFGDMESECVGEISEARVMADQRAAAGTRAAAAWN